MSKRIQQTEEPVIVKLSGKINELDTELGTRLLRYDQGAALAKLRYVHDLEETETLAEEVKRVFDSDERVTITGYRNSPRVDVYLLLLRHTKPLIPPAAFAGIELAAPPAESQHVPPAFRRVSRNLLPLRFR